MISVGSVVLGCLEKGDLEVLCSHHLKTLKFFKVTKLSNLVTETFEIKQFL